MVRSLDEMVPSLSARSVVLSVLLGLRPPRLSANELVRIGEHVGITPNAMRVSLSRMAAAGDLEVTSAVYSLAERHRRRHAASEARLSPRRRQYTGMWHTIVLTGQGRSVEERLTTRAGLSAEHFAELREGVWMRPDNLVTNTAGPEFTAAHVSMLSIVDDARGLSRRLWDLDTWSAEARIVVGALAGPDPSGTGSRTDLNIVRLRAAAAAVRMLATDPVLPEELMPEYWPADELRWEYEEFRRDFAARHLAGISLQGALHTKE